MHERTIVHLNFVRHCSTKPCNLCRSCSSGGSGGIIGSSGNISSGDNDSSNFSSHSPDYNIYLYLNNNKYSYIAIKSHDI